MFLPCGVVRITVKRLRGWTVKRADLNAVRDDSLLSVFKITSRKDEIVFIDIN